MKYKFLSIKMLLPLTEVAIANEAFYFLITAPFFSTLCYVIIYNYIENTFYNINNNNLEDKNPCDFSSLSVILLMEN